MSGGTYCGGGGGGGGGGTTMPTTPALITLGRNNKIASNSVQF